MRVMPWRKTQMGEGAGADMFWSTVAMGILAACLVGVAAYRGVDLPVQGARDGLVSLLKVVPLLIFAFVIIGTLPLLLPKDLFLEWAGGRSGWRGLLLGTLAGGLFPGGPIIQATFGAVLLKSGAGIGTIVAFLTAGVLWHVSLLPVEIGLLGWRVTVLRLASTFFFPPLAGLIAHALASFAGR
jgi:uncharacterized membrane protein YraQ (UPF0718 family)